MAGDIIYIDDEPDALVTAAADTGSRPRIETLPPPYEGDAERNAADANLWVFDFFNDDHQRNDPTLSGMSGNGLSVFQQFRLIVGDARPPAVLVSNHLEEALGADPQLKRPHLFAERLGVEWIAEKRDPNALMAKLLDLANAVSVIRSAAVTLADADPSSYVAVLSEQVLKTPNDVSWWARAVAGISSWRPPAWQGVVDDLRPRALKDRLPVRQEMHSTRAVVAWLLRQVLPHSSFLITDRQVAARLRMDLECLRQALRQNTELSRHLGPSKYSGVLAEFDGSRWWSAGVDAFDFSLPGGGEARTVALTKLVAPVALIELPFDDPVVVSDEDLVEIDEIAPAKDCVRAADEAFPAQALPAWVKIDDARMDRLLAKKVRLDDQHLLVEPK